MLWLIAGLLAVIAFLIFLTMLEVNAAKDVLVKILDHFEGRGKQSNRQSPR